MATKVTFVDKAGKTCSSTFPTRALAESYARTVRKPVLEDVVVEVAQVAVQACPEGTLDAQRKATKAYYDGWKAPAVADAVQAQEDGAPGEDEESDAYLAARFNGASPEDAWADVVAVRSRRRSA